MTKRGWGLLYLGIATALLLVSNGRDTVAVAAWLAPIFLLRSFRLLGLALATPLAAVVLLLTWAFEWRGMVPVPLGPFWAIDAGYALCALLPFLADGWVGGRWRGVASTLVFPAAWTATEFLFQLFNPYGTWGAAAYTQYGDLPLVQLVAVTGLGGITFLIGWVASSANMVWERGIADRRALRAAFCCAAVLGGALLFGGLRLALQPASGPTVRVASLSRRQPQLFPSEEVANRFARGTLTAADTQAIATYWRGIADDLLARSEREAAAGARLVFWSELGAPVLRQDEPALLARGAAFAQAHGVFLGMALGTVDPAAPRPFDNKLALVAPDGRVAWQYRKARPVPGGEAAQAVPNDGQLRVVETELGRLSSAICFDMDFPALLAQAGRAGVQILLVPAKDWAAIDPWHAEMASFRAVEQGFSMIRQTEDGLSLAVDFQGRVLARQDDLRSADHAMVAQMPVRAGATTLYSLWGESFAWLTTAATVAFLALAVAGRPARS